MFQATKPQGLFTTNNRALAISHFYESNFGPKNQLEHREGLDRFPNLFNKQNHQVVVVEIVTHHLLNFTLTILLNNLL